MSPTEETKSHRLALQVMVEALNNSPRKSRSRSLAITKLEEASMWLGKDLQELREADPYPNSRDPSNPVIDPSAKEACRLARPPVLPITIRDLIRTLPSKAHAGFPGNCCVILNPENGREMLVNLKLLAMGPDDLPVLGYQVTNSWPTLEICNAFQDSAGA